MCRNVFLCAWFIIAAPFGMRGQSFLLSQQYSAAIPVGPITGVGPLSAARDSQSNLYVLASGLTNNCLQIPLAGCVLQPASQLVKMNPEAGAIVFQQTLPTPATAMTVDPGGNIYLTIGNVIEKLASDGSQVLYKKTIGGSSLTFEAVTMDSSGRLYLTGNAGAGDLPATAGSFRPAAPAGNGPFGFAIRLNSSGGLDYATYLGDAVQNPYGIAVDGSGAAFIVWSSNSTNFPSTPLAGPNGASFLVRLAPDASKLIYSTSPTAGIVFQLAADPAGQAAIALETAYGAGVTVMSYNPDGSIAFTRNVPGVLAAGLAADAEGNFYLSDSLLPASANYPVRNSLASCTSAQSALTVFDGSGNVVQSTYLATPAGLEIVSGSGLDLFSNSALGNPLAVTHFVQSLTADIVPLACVGNAASYAGSSISPGELISLFGNSLGPSSGAQPQVGMASGFPAELAGVKVIVNGIPAPLLYVQDGQINAIVPWEVQAGGQADVCVTYSGSTACFTMATTDTQPGVFMLDADHAAALNQNGTLNTASNPEKVGDVVSIFATGLGAINPLPADGSIVGFPLPVDLLPVSMATVSATGLGILVPLTMKYFGPAPGEVAGFSQINFTVDANVGGPYATYLYAGFAQSNPFQIYVAQ